MKKKFIAVFAALCMVISMLGACGNAEGSKETTKPENKETQAQAGETTAGGETQASAKETEAPDNADDEDMADVNMVFLSMSTIPQDLPLVVEALNEITEKEINTHVNIEMIEVGNYDQQIGLKTSSNEKVDLMLTLPMGSSSFNNMAAQNQLMDITELLNEYGKGVLDTVGDLVNATTKDGKIVGVTTYRSLVSSEYIIMRTDVLEDLGLLEKAQNMKSMSEYTEILKAVKESEKWGNLAGIVASDGQGTCMPLAGGYIGVDSFEDAYVYDQLGDLNKIIAINPDGSDPTVKNNFASDEYKAMWKQMKDWYDAGYVYKDVTTTKEMAEDLVKSNVAFSYFSQSELGVEAAKSTACGTPVTCVRIITLPISTSSCTKFVWAVPSSATEPEAAVKLLNLMYTSPEVENLLAYGIEGTHYQVKDGVGYYMDGQDVSSCGYHTADFLFGNQFNCLPFDGQDPDIRTQAKEEMDAAITSAYLGFSCDTTTIQSEISAVVNVLAEFRPSVDSGLASDTDYQNFLDKLDASGLPTIIAEYQKQLDEWLAANK